MRVRLDASTQEFEELSHELRNCEVAARALEHLMAAHECLQQAERSVAAQSYSAASEALSRLQHVLDTICESSEGSARVVQVLSEFSGLSSLRVQESRRLLLQATCSWHRM